jgi:hypothetical protein
MAIRIIVECDSCGDEAIAYEGITTKKQIKAILRFNNWSVGARTLCPKCKRKKTGSTKP